MEYRRCRYSWVWYTREEWLAYERRYSLPLLSEWKQAMTYEEYLLNRHQEVLSRGELREAARDAREPDDLCSLMHELVIT